MRKQIVLATSILMAGSIASADITFESFDAADTDNNSKVSKDEFYGLVSDAGIFADWDYDADGFIEENEYADIGLDNDFDAWDADDDSYLSSDELYDGYFSTFDEDENGHWNDLEWDDAGDAGLFDV